MQRRYLTEEEQRRLLAAARSCADPLAQRDYHWMAALLLTGMRIKEFSRLTVPQVRQALHTGWLVSRKEDCKGKRGNEYLVTAPLRAHLEALLKLDLGYAVPVADATPLVWGRDHDAMSVRSYQARMKHWAQVAGLDSRLSPHWCRHSRGMNIIRRSRAANPLKVAQLALGHASIASTGIYTQMSREEYEAELHQVDAGRLSKRQARRAAEVAA